MELGYSVAEKIIPLKRYLKETGNIWRNLYLQRTGLSTSSFWQPYWIGSVNTPTLKLSIFKIPISNLNPLCNRKCFIFKIKITVTVTENASTRLSHVAHCHEMKPTTQRLLGPGNSWLRKNWEKCWKDLFAPKKKKTGKSDWKDLFAPMIV